jgi:alkanesulfonate monooxygenase SsuD/methylene tetrahydromethanopterin reductase-like flavin-dependent oxidoreductase (luciferase family)
MLDLDLRRVPGAMVATTAFRDAAAAQARSLGFEPAIVWVQHPIQDRTDEELRAIADEALGPILAAICSGPAS